MHSYFTQRRSSVDPPFGTSWVLKHPYFTKKDFCRPPVLYVVGVITIQRRRGLQYKALSLKTVTHAILSPYGLYLYLYMYGCGCTYWWTLRMFSWGTLQHRQSDQRPSLLLWSLVLIICNSDAFTFYKDLRPSLPWSLTSIKKKYCFSLNIELRSQKLCMLISYIVN